jgi:Yip1-like protein
MKGVPRVINILIDPFAEWARIEQEPGGDPVMLLIRYVAPLALVPAVFGFVGACIIGIVVPGKGEMRAPIFDCLAAALFGYAASFAVVLLLGLVADIAAPLFAGRRNFAGALKLAVYSYTPVWLAGIFLLLPGLRFLMLLGFYGVYVLIAGVAPMTKTPRQNLLAFVAMIVAFACALTFIALSAQHALFGAAA